MGLDSWVYSVPKRSLDFEKTKSVVFYKMLYDPEPEQVPEKSCIEVYKDLFEKESEVLTEQIYWRKAWDIHRWFVRYYQDNVDDCKIHKELTRKDIICFRDFVKENLKKYNYGECVVVNAYRYEDDGSTKVIPCDGIEVSYGDGKTKRFDKEYPIVINEDPDDWEKMHYEQALEGCNEILCNFDFDNNYLFYLSSW